LDQQPDKTVVLPVRRAKGSFSKVALQRYGLEIDHFSFEMVRDIATELGLVNWGIVEEEERWQHVYLVVDMVLGRRAKKGGHIRVQSDEGVYTITFIKLKPKTFLAVLAEAYLELTDDRPKYPVLYPEIRGKVCEGLRVSDEVFDANVFSLMKKRQKVKLGDAVFRMIIYPSSGVLNYARLPPNMLKHLPPKQSGKFISFLKIDIHRERGAGGY
jgi:hypothetical protein